MISDLCCVKGRTLDDRGDTKEALELLSRAIGEDETNAYPYKIRSDLYKREGKLIEADADFTKAEELQKKFKNR